MGADMAQQPSRSSQPCPCRPPLLGDPEVQPRLLCLSRLPAAQFLGKSCPVWFWRPWSKQCSTAFQGETSTWRAPHSLAPIPTKPIPNQLLCPPPRTSTVSRPATSLCIPHQGQLPQPPEKVPVLMSSERCIRETEPPPPSSVAPGRS